MTTVLTVFQAQVDALIDANETEFSAANRQAMVVTALETYSRDHPDKHTDDVTGDAGRYYPISTSLTSWSEGFSQILTIEYPAATVASDEAPQYLEPEDWRSDYWAADVRYLYLPNHAPAATEKMRITYTIPYTFAGTPSATTTPAGDFYAICNLGAAYCCRALAAQFSRATTPTLGMDSVNHESKARNFAARAKEFEALYRAHVGTEKGATAAGEFVDWDTAPGWPAGRRYVFH